MYGPTSTLILRSHHLRSVVMEMDTAVRDGHRFPSLPLVLRWQLVSAVGSTPRSLHVSWSRFSRRKKLFPIKK
ncbi:hypothetical protein Bca52824_057444 [Brassica carinata]|uniref:Uncharacterized protein n=1 Tax=Brassica carinata TaxID=52824 RepID=A0A8X7UDT6_BRACI|nr:hypothetical protein Bca52824_057444 [Brassica carinata]